MYIDLQSREPKDLEPITVICLETKVSIDKYKYKHTHTSIK
jgi:hypothetical protein